MLHVRPVLEKDASEKVSAVYEDIKKTLHIHFVPLLFQYIAGFEEYFVYAWEKQKTNLVSDYYMKAVEHVSSEARKSINLIYHPSRNMQQFLHNISQLEKLELSKTVGELEYLNSQLLILAIGLREGVKGVSIGQQFLPKDIDGNYEEEVFDQFINEKIMHNNLRQQEDLIPAAKMLSPLTGNSSLMITHYPEFFAHVADEMEELSGTEKYLHERVVMEHTALNLAMNLPYPLGCSYAEIASFAGRKPYFGELLYVLAETFPTKFPRLTFTTSLMHELVK